MFETFLAEGMETRQQLSIGVSVQADRTLELGCDRFQCFLSKTGWLIHSS